MIDMIKVNKFYINRNNSLDISVSCKLKHDPDVFEPKLKIYAEEGDKNLLLPILQIKSYFFQDKNEIGADFSEEYPLKDFFPSNSKWKKLKISMILFYGDKEIREFFLDIDDNKELDKSEDYKVTIKDSYFLVEKINDKKTIQNIKLGLSYFIRTIALIISILLIPYFIIESIFICLRIPGIKSDRDFKYLNKDTNPIKNAIVHIIWRLSNFSNFKIGEFVKSSKKWLINLFYHLIRRFSKKTDVLFLSERDIKLTGNLKFIHDYIQDMNEKNLNISNSSDKTVSISVSTINQTFSLSPLKHRLKTYIKMARADIILFDAYFSKLNYFTITDQFLIQVWHACGAFKTFGFSRLGRPGAPGLKDTANRKYDLVTVSSDNVIDCYSEAFGISNEKVQALGIPRTDVFFDDNYKIKIKNDFYTKYPKLKDKKIILFAPTYRGKNRKTGYYPIDAFNPVNLYNTLNEEYAILMKHHFFVKDHFEVPEKYKDVIIDIPINDDINNLLIVSDILITDYSSVVFESSLLNIPTLFYSFDLEEYISQRSFYFEYKSFVPGKIVYNEKELTNSIINGDFEEYKLDKFKNDFFKYRDGKSTERIASFILEKLNK
ncbi:MAG: CDP-glycerol glycerophosphotransferase family protein [Methanobrevibacter sp.]|jgi:CDP-glycerol glycerophosphotransferase (TagB/SpsB family)|nr:CDP-glycerol glycerophosphotransferase family protein [Candidatus Methanoflexus mossambicus]